MIEAKEGLVVHCEKCKHEWSLAMPSMFPMGMDKMKKILANLTGCPSCKAAKKDVVMGPVPKPTDNGAK